MRRLIAVMLCVCFMFLAAMYGPAQATVPTTDVVPAEIGVPDVLDEVPDVYIEIEVPLPPQAVVEDLETLEYEVFDDGEFDFYCHVD